MDRKQFYVTKEGRVIGEGKNKKWQELHTTHGKRESGYSDYDTNRVVHFDRFGNVQITREAGDNLEESELGKAYRGKNKLSMSDTSKHGDSLYSMEAWRKAANVKEPKEPKQKLFK